MSEFIAAPAAGAGWFVTFYPGNDTQFVFVLRGWEFDEGSPIGHPMVSDPCDLYRDPLVRAQTLADDFGWGYFDAGARVWLQSPGQVMVGSDPRDPERESPCDSEPEPTE